MWGLRSVPLCLLPLISRLSSLAPSPSLLSDRSWSLLVIVAVPRARPRAFVTVAALHPIAVSSPLRQLDAEKSWKPSLTIKHLLLGIQTLLDDPNNQDPAQEEPYRAYKNDRKDYETLSLIHI